MKESWKHEFVNINGLRMHYVTQGTGKLVLLLHGFPDFWYVWRHQIPELAKHFRVVAPDLRGYNKTDKPSSMENYRLNLTEKLVILNSPHPNAYTSKAKHSFKQLQKSWYIFFFQIPDIPEEVLSRNNYSFLKHMVKLSFVKKEALTDEDLRLYKEAWSQPGALTAMMNYYRMNMNPSILFSEKTITFPKVTSPTLIVWGEQDVALSRSLIENTEEFVDASYSIRYIPNCGHWVQLERPKLVNKYIKEFLKS